MLHSAVQAVTDSQRRGSPATVVHRNPLNPRIMATPTKRSQRLRTARAERAMSVVQCAKLTISPAIHIAGLANSISHIVGSIRTACRSQRGPERHPNSEATPKCCDPQCLAFQHR
jgi:hypothetical protein